MNAISRPTQDLLNTVFLSFKGQTLVDHHAHIFGNGSDPTGDVYLNPRLFSPRHLMEYARFTLFKQGLRLNLGDISSPEVVNRQIIDRLLDMVERFVDGDGNRMPLKVCLFALDKVYRPDGTPDPDNTQVYVSSDYVMHITQLYPQQFIPVISVHPYRLDAIKELQRLYDQGARIVKWLPNAMDVDPGDAKCDPLYDFLRDHDMVLISHTGMEIAIRSKNRQHLGNPKLLKRPLERGVKVIAAHCAALGWGHFDCWVEMMRRYPNFYGDISAVVSMPMMLRIPRLLELTEFHHRLVNGSDWPVPTLLYASTLAFWFKGFISREERQCLNEIYRYNPLLFDFALKRVIRHPHRPALKFPDSLFLRNASLF